MDLIRILNHVYYSGLHCPEGVHPARWRGILRWLTARAYI